MSCCLCRYGLQQLSPKQQQLQQKQQQHAHTLTAHQPYIIPGRSKEIVGMSEPQNTHKAVLKVLAELREDIANLIELYNGECVLNLSAVYNAYENAMPDGTAVEQRIVTMALRTKLVEGGVQMLKPIRRATGALGTSNLTPYMHFAEASLQKAKQQVLDILGAVELNDVDGVNIQLLEALGRESKLQQEVSELKHIRDDFRNRMSQMEDENAELRSQLEGWKQQHKADLAWQRLQQPEIDGFKGPYEYLEYVADQHHKNIYSNSAYAREWGYTLHEDGESLYTADGGRTWHVHDYQHTKVGWNVAAIRQRPKLLQGEGKLEGYRPIKGYRALVLLHGDSNRSEPMPQYCGMCGLCFNMRGLGLAEHVIVCSREYGSAP